MMEQIEQRMPTELQRFPSVRKIDVEGELQRLPSKRMLLDVADPQKSALKGAGMQLSTASTISCYSYSTFGDDSVSSSDTDGFIQKVRFSDKQDEVRTIENSFDMSRHERYGLWYDRNELREMKLNSRTVASQMKMSCKHVIAKLAHGYHQSKLIADSGIETDDIEAVVQDLSTWTATELESESCRGIEKALLRRDREAVAREARHFVIEARKFCEGEDVDHMAEVYGELSRYAALFAHALAQADAHATTTS